MCATDDSFLGLTVVKAVIYNESSHWSMPRRQNPFRGKRIAAALTIPKTVDSRAILWGVSNSCMDIDTFDDVVGTLIDQVGRARAGCIGTRAEEVVLIEPGRMTIDPTFRNAASSIAARQRRIWHHLIGEGVVVLYESAEDAGKLDRAVTRTRGITAKIGRWSPRALPTVFSSFSLLEGRMLSRAEC